MAELRGGTTIAGFTALHSGLKEAFLGGNLTINEQLNVGSSINITAQDMFASRGGALNLKNGDITGANNIFFNDTSEDNEGLQFLMSGKQIGSTSTSDYYTFRIDGGGVAHINSYRFANSNGVLYYKNQDTDIRYVQKESDPYISVDTDGNSSYPRLVVKNSGASTPSWLRVNSTSHGILPYSNENSFIGTSSWKFKEIHSVNFYENGTALSNKYLGKTAKAADSDKLGGKKLHTGSSSGYQTDVVPFIKTDGAMEVGRYIDFHYSGSTKDFDARIQAHSNGTFRIEGAPVEIQSGLTINEELVVSASNTSANYIRRNSTSPALYVENRGSGRIMTWRKGTSDRAWMENSGALILAAGSDALQLAAGPEKNHVYMEFFAQQNDYTNRSGYIGYPNDSSNNLEIFNSLGDVELRAKPGSRVTTGGYEIYHAGKEGLAPLNSKRMAANTNFNSITTPGFYFNNYDGDTQTMANRPNDNAFWMMVLQAAGVVQISGNYQGDRIWMRRQYSGSWSSWIPIYTGMSLRHGTGDPSGGSNGDIYIKY